MAVRGAYFVVPPISFAVFMAKKIDFAPIFGQNVEIDGASCEIARKWLRHDYLFLTYIFTSSCSMSFGMSRAIHPV